MQKILIEMDNDKIARENKYSIEKINIFLNSLFEKRNMKLDSEGWYSNGNFTTCGSAILILSKKQWFTENVKKWLWYDTMDSSTDDLKAFYCEGSRT